MLFLAIYLAIQIEYILLATFRSEAVYLHVCVKLHLECWDWFLCGVLGLLLMKKSFGFNLAFGCACQRSHFLSDFAVCQTEVSFYCFLSGFGTITPCSLLSFAPGGVLSWAAGKQRHCLLTEANVALGVKDCLCFHCCCNVFHLLQTCSSATFNSGRLKISCILRSTFAIKSKRD